ncbi:MAG: glycosyltransferase family 4 protein [Pedobacter sp.]
MSVIKVAVIEPVGGYGGMGYYDFGLCEGLESAGVEVSLHTNHETTPPAGSKVPLHFCYRDIFGNAPVWKRAARYIRGTLSALVHAVLRSAPLVHFHFFNVGPLETFNVVAAKVSGRKIVATIHDVESFAEWEKMPLLARFVYPLVNHFIVHNQVSRDELIRVARIHPERIAVIPHGNYLSMLGEAPLLSETRRKLNVPDHAKVLLFFGQIKDVKGLDLLLEAMPNVLKEHPYTVLLIAGRPWKTNFESYSEQISHSGIQESCLCHIRYIPDEEVPLFYGIADLVVLPYRRIYQSGVVLMAMSYGRAVLASDLPGMKEVITDDDTGFLFKSGDAQALALRLNEVLDQDDLVAAAGKRGKELMRERYDWGVIGSMTAAVYRSVCVSQ